MGSRANIELVFSEVTDTIPGAEASSVWFYTHNRGESLPAIVASALSRHERWDDHCYLARMIFDELTDGDRSNLGFGIGVGPCDDQYPNVHIDMEDQTVTLEGVTLGYSEFIAAHVGD